MERVDLETGRGKSLLEGGKKDEFARSWEEREVCGEFEREGMLGAVKRGLLEDGKEGWVFLELRKGKSPLKARKRTVFSETGAEFS